MLPPALILLMAADAILSNAWAAEIDSVQVDRVAQKLIVIGSGFDV